MASISSSLTAILTQAKLAAAAQASQQTATASTTTDDPFGSATQVTLSTPAQAVVAAQGSASTTSASATPAASPAKSPQVPVTSSSTDSSLVQQLAEQQLIPEVGVVSASEVVDKSGNIDHALLTQILSQQAAQKTSITA